jgi:hypothetical protein
MIEDRKVALSYAVEALRIFDHLHFRDAMKKGQTKPDVITLMKPTAISGKPTWFAEYYVPNTQKQKGPRAVRDVATPGVSARTTALRPRGLRGDDEPASRFQ